MNRPAIRGGAAALAAVLLTGPARAQDPSPLVLTPHEATQLFSGPYFFLAILAGLVLAVGFQFLLTNLSFAAGVSALKIGPHEDVDDRGAARDGGAVTFGQRARKVTAGIGLWALITASIALFFASWLAVELSLTISALIGAIIGLVIWALFYLVMTTFQATAAWSLVGTLFRTVGGGLRSAWSGVSGVFSKSEEARVTDMAAKITRSVKDELFRDVRMDRVREEVRGYVQQLAPKPIDPAAVRREVQQLLDETEIQAVAEHEGEPLVPRETVVSVLRMRQAGHQLHPRDVAAVAQGVDEALRVIKDEAFSEKDRVSAVADTALRLTGKSKDEALHTRQQVEEWLRSTGKEALDPDGIKRDLERLFYEPSLGFGALRDRVRAIDRDTIETVLSQRSDVSKEEAHRIVETVENWSRNVLAKGRQMRPEVGSARERAVGKIRAYLESIQRPGLEDNTIRTDVERILEEAGAGGHESIAERVKAIDRDTIKNILASRRDLSEADAERIIQQVEAARDSVGQRMRALRDEVERRLLAARDETWHQAEEARKTAASAAWWSVATAIVSAIAAAFGGMVAVAAG